MTDYELLRKYEPVLRFVHGERFFPMRVETFVDACHGLYVTRRYRSDQNVTETWQQLAQSSGATMAETLGTEPLKTSRHHLRYLAPQTFLTRLRDRLLWIVLLIVTAAISVIVLGLDWQRAAVFVVVLIPPLFMSSNRGVFIGAILFFLAVAGITTLAATVGHWTSILTGIIIGIPVLMLFVSLLPGFLLDITSWATDEDAFRAAELYEATSARDPATRYTCYGTVWRDGTWTALQYQYFYAFNNWRQAANGINHHEGDWEATTVYLKQGEPYGVAYSQHHEGAFRFWTEARTVHDPESGKQEATHPLVYVALGSHANYAEPSLITAPEHLSPGVLQLALYWLDQAIHRANNAMRWLILLIPHAPRQVVLLLLRLLLRYSQYYPARLRKSLIRAARVREQQTPELPKIPSFFTEIATGDGLRIGVSGTYDSELTSDRQGNLTYAIPVPDSHAPTWNLEVIPPAGWVEFQGLWGSRYFFPDESGPPGPRWGRAHTWTDALSVAYQRIRQKLHKDLPDYCQNIHRKNAEPDERRRWADPLGWKTTLLLNTVKSTKHSQERRRRALEELARKDDLETLQQLNCLLHMLSKDDPMWAEVKKKLPELQGHIAALRAEQAMHNKKILR